MTRAIATQYYKVLVDNHSCHGGDFDWTDYLPMQGLDDTWKPGLWTPPVDDVHVCNSGWHLTTDPMQWPKVGMQVYMAEGDGHPSVRDDKSAFRSVRLLEPADHVVPDYWRDVEAFVRDLPNIPWLQPQVDTLPPAINGVPIRLFDTRAAARDAADAAALFAQILVCAGLTLDQEHIDHATARMEVWRLGYGVHCDVNGTLFAYRSLT